MLGVIMLSVVTPKEKISSSFSLIGHSSKIVENIFQIVEQLN